MTSVAEAKAALVAAEEAEKEHARRAREEAKQHQEELARLAKENAGRVDALEKKVASALALPDDETLAPLPVRKTCRGYLHGTLGELPELYAPEDAAAAGDDRCGLYLGLQRECAQLYEMLTDPGRASFLPGGPLMERLDRCEHACWHAFVRRVRIVAGE